MSTNRLVTTAAAFSLLMASLIGCPKVSLQEVAIQEGSVQPNGFTLSLEVQVIEEDETTGEGNQPAEGRGLVAIYVPADWKVNAGRVLVPGETAQRALYPVPQAAAIFAEGFPTVPGQFWAFASSKQVIHKGSHSYALELDVQTPKKNAKGPIGIAAGILQEDMSELPPLVEYTVQLKGKSGKLLQKAAAKPPAAAPTPAPGKSKVGSG